MLGPMIRLFLVRSTDCGHQFHLLGEFPNKCLMHDSDNYRRSKDLMHQHLDYEWSEEFFKTGRNFILEISRDIPAVYDIGENDTVELIIKGNDVTMTCYGHNFTIGCVAPKEVALRIVQTGRVSTVVIKDENDEMFDPGAIAADKFLSTMLDL